MLEIMHAYGLIAVAGRQGGQRLWDLAERWFPAVETMPVREADRALAEQRFRALGVRRTKAGLGGASRRERRARAATA